MRLVLDTSVLVDHLRGRRTAATELIPRAVVTALALELKAELKTTNLKHFPMFKGLRAPY